jgi:predicted nucleic acid-binding protein
LPNWKTFRAAIETLKLATVWTGNASAGYVTRSEVLESPRAADPYDNRILECAAEGKADLIVSNDHHLLELKIWNQIPIVAGVDFRRTLGLR